jgi:DNA-directed RNA polymerase subunit M/transcription elongation factor TFIIS
MNDGMPCPLCGVQLDIRESVKSKPYVVCDPCGMQMFIRKETGINALKRILASEFPPSNPTEDKLREKVQSLETQLVQIGQKYEVAKNAHTELTQTKNRLREKDQAITKSKSRIQALQERISELENSAFRICPECRHEFEISEKLAKTSWLDGSFEGFQCPRDGCKGIGIRRDLEED